MILVEGEKYACEQCIRGHRSSTCKHIKRPLVLVRSRGRPVTDSTQRIAILAEEVEKVTTGQPVTAASDPTKVNPGPVKPDPVKLEPVDDTVRSKCSCCVNSKSSSSSSGDSHTSLPNSPTTTGTVDSPASSITEANPTANPASCGCGKGAEGCSQDGSRSVFILKASKRQVYNVAKDSLKLLDPVVEIPNNQVGLEIMHNLSRVKRHGRNVCRSRHFRRGRCCAKEEEITSHMLDGRQKPQQHQQHQHQHQHQHQPVNASTASDSAPMYNLFVADSCTLPGTCGCAPTSCECSNCVVHNGPKSQIQFQPPMTVESQHQSHRHGHQRPLSQPSQARVQPAQQQLQPSQASTSQYFYPQGDGSAPATENVISFGQLDFQSLLPFVPGSAPRPPVAQSPQTPSDVSTPDCLCESDECACYNCETHGIVNGIRLSDGVRVASLDELPVEMQLAYGQYGPPMGCCGGDGGDMQPPPPPQQQQQLQQSQQSQQSRHPYQAVPKVDPIVDIQFEKSAGQNTSLPTSRQMAAIAASIPQATGLSPADQILLDFSEFDDTCNCPEGQCNCANCFKHGRIGNSDIL